MFDYAKNYEHMKVEITGDGVALVALNRPPHNLINPKLHTEITTIPRDLNHDEDVRAVVFHAGEARNFAAGILTASCPSTKSRPRCANFCGCARPCGPTPTPS